MKTLHSTLIILMMTFTTLGFAQQTEWAFDNAHTGVRFTVSHMVISEVEGNFNDFTGMVTTSGDDFNGAKISFVIEAGSIDTDDEKRDEHLQSADFFDVAQYPQITFESTSMKKTEGNSYALSGNLTMHGVTKAVTLEAVHNGTINDPWGNTKAGFKVKGTLDRESWNLKYNSIMDNGGLMIGNEIEIVCNIELVKKSE